MIKSRSAAFGLYIVLFLAFWNLLDWLYTAFIAGGAYSFTAGGDLIVPLAAALVTGYLLFMRKGKD
jgi:F0F1-type ATP synthase membrane subunit a